MRSKWGLNKDVVEFLQMLTHRYMNPKGVVMDVKWEPDSDNGWAVCGNDWTNIWRGLEFKVTRYELVKDGWKRIDV
jgi:hypothetical protein